MPLGPSARQKEPLFAARIALALVLAAFLGAAVGLVWQSAGFGGEEPAEAEAAD